MSGICIIVSGRSGAGKTTFIKEAVLSSFLNIEYMTSYVTRAPRNNDYGYVYLTKNEYELRRQKSTLWDHFEMFGEYYGTDVEELLDKAKNGKNIIISCFPSLEELDKIEKMYTLPKKSIFIDIDKKLSLQKIKEERQGHELDRIKQEDEAITQQTLEKFNYIFIPENNLTADSMKFVNLLHEILKDK